MNANGNLSNTFARLIDAFRSGDFTKLTRLDHLTPDEKNHLSKVYATLLAGVVITGVGTFSGNALLQGGWFSASSLATIGAIGTVIAGLVINYERATALSDPTQKGVSTRAATAFGAASFSSGLSLTGIVVYTAIVHAQLLVTAIMGAACIFACLSIASLLARRRSMLFLGSIVGTIVSYIMMASLMNLFVRSSIISNFIMLGGLVSALGFTLIDTQSMLETSHYGSAMVVPHAFQLYLDLVNIFVYILRLLLDREEESERRRGRRRAK